MWDLLARPFRKKKEENTLETRVRAGTRSRVRAALQKGGSSLEHGLSPKKKRLSLLKQKQEIEEEEKAKELALQEARETAWREILAKAVYRDGYRVNDYPAVALTTPPDPPAESEAEKREREGREAVATAAIADNLDKYIEILKDVSLFRDMGDTELELAARNLQVRHFRAGQIIYDEGDEGHDCWVLEVGTAIASVLMPGIVVAGTLEWKETRPFKPGRFGSFFGERGLRRGEPRKMRITCRTDVTALRVSRENYVACARIREYKENLLRGVRLFEQMTDDQIGKLAAVIQSSEYAAGEAVYTKGSVAEECFIVERGVVDSSQCVSIAGRSHSHKSATHVAGEMFGAAALMAGDGEWRDSTAIAMTSLKVSKLRRDDFERLLGPLAQLQKAQLAADPRTLLSHYYQAGDARGPAGTLALKGVQPDEFDKTSWFAVYRPCSRDSIAKMLGGVGVGKGLNIKGKSAQKNRLSGFVPFLQISENQHKRMVETSPANARTKIFYKNVMAREEALAALTKVLREIGHQLDIAVPNIFVIRDYEPASFGLDVPEGLIREAYIMRPDITPTVGWETGRPSVPQFMDMNLHGVRGNSIPQVCLYQYDLSDPMNPLGLLIAYAEAAVKPVCSDFDTFTVGSKGMKYEPLPPEQVSLIEWELSWAEDVIRDAQSDTKNWTKHWLDVIKREDARGFHPNLPEFGFGDPTSSRLIVDVVNTVRSCGAVRHGAECFNFYFPQELDKDFLIIWEGFSDPVWRTFSEVDLRRFLIERVREGYSFPINPVWPVRDCGWYEVFSALQESSSAAQAMEAWYPKESGLREKISSLHQKYPRGFEPMAKPMEVAEGPAMEISDQAGMAMAELALKEASAARPLPARLLPAPAKVVEGEQKS